jgi:hypothetical protein
MQNNDLQQGQTIKHIHTQTIRQFRISYEMQQNMLFQIAMHSTYILTKYDHQ